jgi:voltage-gated potassium channel
MDFTLDYLQIFFMALKLASPLLASSALLIVLLGMIVGMRESWGRLDSIYWAYITATTVGYGDIRPTTPASKILSILISLVGMTFTGILVALAVYAATTAMGEQEYVEALKACIEKIE